MTKLPANEVDSAVALLDREYVIAGVLTTAEGARARMQADLSRHLHAGELATVPLAYVIAMGDHGHEPAQLALAEYIGTYIDQKRFNELTPGLQDYAKRVLLKPELPGYGRGHKIIDTWTRDVVINFLVGRAMARWRLKKKPAAYLVGLMFKRRGETPSSTRGVLNIYDNRDSLGERLARFMLAEIPDDGPPAEAGAV